MYASSSRSLVQKQHTYLIKCPKDLLHSQEIHNAPLTSISRPFKKVDLIFNRIEIIYTSSLLLIDIDISLNWILNFNSISTKNLIHFKYSDCDEEQN